MIKLIRNFVFCGGAMLAGLLFYRFALLIGDPMSKTQDIFGWGMAAAIVMLFTAAFAYMFHTFLGDEERTSKRLRRYKEWH